VRSSNEFDGGFDTVSEVGPANLSVYKGGKIGIGPQPEAPPRRASFQQRGLLRVSGKDEGDQPTVAVVIGAELRQPQCPTADELLQGGTAGLW
jgi:hypothetical protein